MLLGHLVDEVHHGPVFVGLGEHSLVANLRPRLTAAQEKVLQKRLGEIGKQHELALRHGAGIGHERRAHTHKAQRGAGGIAQVLRQDGLGHHAEFLEDGTHRIALRRAAVKPPQQDHSRRLCLLGLLLLRASHPVSSSRMKPAPSSPLVCSSTSPARQPPACACATRSLSQHTRHGMSALARHARPRGHLLYKMPTPAHNNPA